MAGNINMQHLKNDSPLEAPSLLELSAGIVANNTANLLLYFPEKQASQQQPSSEHDHGLLPVHASEKVLQKLCEKWRGRSNMSSEELDSSLAPFYNGKLFPVANANFSNVKITDRMLAAFLVGQRETLTSLNLINSTKGMSAALLCSILRESEIKLERLRSLKLNSLDILRIPRVGRVRRRVLAPQFVHFCPNLEHLYLLEVGVKSEFLVRIFSELPKLKTLDLSGCVLRDDLSPLKQLRSLTTLVLYDVPDLETCIFTVAELTTLRHLDISQSDLSHGEYAQPVSTLHQLVSSLKKLQCLDISGTNLTVEPSENDDPFAKETTGAIDSDIPGLRCLERPLKFLGIFNCEGTSAEWKNIPAEKISGEHGEDQLLTAMEMYLERPETVQIVLAESYELYKEEGSNLHRHAEALHLVLRSLELHLDDEDVQIAGIPSMITILHEVEMNWDTKRRVIQALIDGTENHMDSSDVVHNCSSGLCHFDIPQDVMFAYGQVANLLAKMLQTQGLCSCVQRRVISLLDSMVSFVKSKQKDEMGKAGAIEVILKHIAQKLQTGTCDDLLELCWSFLWRVTDGTPANCERFSSAEGVGLFKQCYKKFGDQNAELVRKMLGVIGNIAEVRHLRNQMITNECVLIFCKLLDNMNKGNGVSHYSAGMLTDLINEFSH